MKKYIRKTTLILTAFFMIFNMLPYRVTKVLAAEEKTTISDPLQPANEAAEGLQDSKKEADTGNTDAETKVTDIPDNKDNTDTNNKGKENSGESNTELNNSESNNTDHIDTNEAQITQAPEDTSNSLKAEITEAAQAFTNDEKSMAASNSIHNNKQKSDPSASDITIDGYYDDWEDKPYSWEYNWNNPWRIDDYWDGKANVTKEYRDSNGREYNLDVRHKMQIYTDGTNVYLHIIIASNTSYAVNGDDYEFTIDGKTARFRLTYMDDSSITQGYKGDKPGIYTIQVRHGDSALSDQVVDGAEAVYTRYSNDQNNELELKIPLEAMKEQNSKMKTDHYNFIDFFTPNLMYRRIACSGASTGPFVGAVLCLIFAGGAVFMKKRKSRSDEV